MKIHGKEIKGPSEEILALPRASSFMEVEGEPTSDGKKKKIEVNNDIIIIVRAVLDFTEFDALCPMPTPPKMIVPGSKETQVNTEDRDFNKAIKGYANLKWNWMLLKSLSATPGLEWDTIDMQNPSTWENLDSELLAAGLNISERNKVKEVAAAVNSLDEKRVEEARNRFLASRAEVARIL